MVFSLSLDKTRPWYMEHTDNTVSSVKRRKKLRWLREFRVQKVLNPDFEKAMSAGLYLKKSMSERLSAIPLCGTYSKI
jgi:hypothetical protein